MAASASNSNGSGRQSDVALAASLTGEDKSDNPRPVRSQSDAETAETSASARYSNTTGERTLLSSLWSGNASTIAVLNNSTDSPSHPIEPPSTSPSLSQQLHLSAFRSRFKHRAPKSTGSVTTLSSQPVLVRAYTGNRSRPPSRAPSLAPSLPNHTMGVDAKLPPLEAFTFDGMLRAVEPDIQDAIDAIAGICARSRMSLADQHSSHMPPQGEIMAGRTGAGPPGSRLGRFGLGIRTTGLENTLTAVPEASSSSERLAGSGSKASSRSGKDNGKRKLTAYGSLQNIFTRSLSQQGSVTSERRSSHKRAKSAGWVVEVLSTSGEHSGIVITGQEVSPSKQLSLESTSKSTGDEVETRGQAIEQVEVKTMPPPVPVRTVSDPTGPSTSWFRKPRIPTKATARLQNPPTRAENALKDLLRGGIPTDGHG